MTDVSRPAGRSVASAVPKPPADRVGDSPTRDEDPSVAENAGGEVVPGIGVLSRRGVLVLTIALGLLVAGLALRYSTLVGVSIALLCAVAIDVVAVLREPDLRIRRTVTPSVVERHEPCVATLRVSGRRPMLARIGLADRAGRQLRWVELDSDEISYRVPTLRRGLIQVGPLAVSRIGVFGLAIASGTQGALDHVRVLPRRLPVHRMPRGRRRSAVGADESAERGGTDLVGLHDYVPGDDLRRIHWATSARTGRVMVRDDADPATLHLTVVLDDEATHYADHAGADTDFEDAVEVAYALCRAAADERLPVHLVTTSGAIDVESTPRPAAMGSDLRRLDAAVAEVQSTRAPESTDRPSSGANAEPAPSAVRSGRGLRLPRGLDAVAVISGSRGPTGVLGEIAARGSSGVLLLVDDAEARTEAMGTVPVLRGAHAIDLTRLWDRVSA